MQLNNIQLPQTATNPQHLLFVTAQQPQSLAQNAARPGKKIKSESPNLSPYSSLPNDSNNWHQPAPAPHPNAEPSAHQLLNYDPNSLLTLSPPSLSPPPTEAPPAPLQTEQLLFDHEQGSPVSYSASADFGTVTDNDLLSIMAFMDQKNTTRLNALHELTVQVAQRIEKICFEQRCLPLPPQAKEPYEAVDIMHQEAAKVVDSALKELESIKSTVLLCPQDICKLNTLHVEFQMFMKQLEIYQLELRHMASPQWSQGRCFSALMIAKQPFPKSIKQNIKTSTPTDDPVVVRLFAPAKIEIRPASVCKAELVFEDYQAKRSDVIVQNDTQEFNQQGVATFVDLRFPQGTRLKTVRVQFTVQVQFVQPDQSMGMALVESEPSNPFIVMTNENQWDVAEGILLQRDAFGAGTETTWFHFANTLQIHYLKATRQDTNKPQRALSAADLHYIHEIKLENKPIITLKDFERFWEWFGKVLHKIRHQRHLSLLWLKGLIFGFIPKEAAEEILRNQEVGTFLLRFSERIAGQFAIAYVTTSKAPGALQHHKEVKHYLLKPEDITGPNKTLADFLKTRDNFMFLVEKKTEFLPDSGIIKGTYAKHQILEEFYTKKNFTSIDGYEEEVD